MAKKVEVVERDERLIEVIKGDAKLDQYMKMEFLQLAKFYLSEFKKNMHLTSLELDSEYGFGADTWRDFLQYPLIKKYIDGFMKEMIEKNVDQALMRGEGTRDAIGVKKALASEANDHSNDTFIIFRLPDKEEAYDYTGQI